MSDLSPEFQSGKILSSLKYDEMIAHACLHGVHKFEWVLSKKTGKDFPVEITMTPVSVSGKQVMLMVCQDLTERKIQEALLLEKQDELRAFVEAAPAAIAMFDKNMNYVAASEKWYDDYKLKNKDIIGKCHYDIFPETTNEWKIIHKRCLSGAIEKEDEEKFVRKNGKVEWMKWEVRPWFTINSDIGGIIMLTEIVTERKNQEDELILAKEKAEEASKAREQFLSTMSHEIRTPLNAVIGITHILIEEDPKKEQVENLKILKFSAENLLVLINDILDYNKIEAGKIDFENIDFSLIDLADGIRKSLSFKAEEKRIRLKLNIDQDIPKILVGDPVRISQVITNLVSNAVKFTEVGGVEINLKLKNQSPEEATITCEVIDSGIGIPKDKINYIFDRFTQASSSTTRKFGGTGLGLAISKKLIELMGGTIKVRSKPGRGSVFYFSVTLKRSTKTELNTFREYNQQEKNLEELNINLLLVEDNEVNQLVATKFLTKWGIRPDYANNGVMAVEKSKAKRYDIILMDIQMPEMDGYQATRIIRQLDNYKKIPIIALTASAMLDVKDKVLTAGMTDYVTKPFNPNDLYNKIFKYLNENVKNKLSINSLEINEHLETFAENDLDFKKELATSYIKSMKELQFEYETSLSNKDLERLRHAIHKNKTALELLQLSQLQLEMEHGKEILSNGTTDKKMIEDSIIHVKDMCNELITHLTNI